MKYEIINHIPIIWDSIILHYQPTSIMELGKGFEHCPHDQRPVSHFRVGLCDQYWSLGEMKTEDVNHFEAQQDMESLLQHIFPSFASAAAPGMHIYRRITSL